MTEGSAHIRYVADGHGQLGQWKFAHHRGASASDGLCQITAKLVAAPGEGKEQITGAHAAGVVRTAGDRDVVIADDLRVGEQTAQRVRLV